VSDSLEHYPVKSNHPRSVLAGLGPAIHEKPLVGPRAKPGEDELGVRTSIDLGLARNPTRFGLLQDVDDRDKPGQGVTINFAQAPRSNSFTG
jgi:hypothetical protein